MSMGQNGRDMKTVIEVEQRVFWTVDVTGYQTRTHEDLVSIARELVEHAEGHDLKVECTGYSWSPNVVIR